MNKLNKNKIMNIHPSLLPDFAGGMDKDVHAEVLKSGIKVTGCTLHFVDETRDGGPIIMQKKVIIEEGETTEEGTEGGTEEDTCNDKGTRGRGRL